GFPPAGPFGLPAFDAPPMLPSAIGSNFGPAFGPGDWDAPARGDYLNARSEARSPYAETRIDPPPDAPACEVREHFRHEASASPHSAAQEHLADRYSSDPAESDDGLMPPEPDGRVRNARQRAANGCLPAARRAAQSAASGGHTERVDAPY